MSNLKNRVIKLEDRAGTSRVSTARPIRPLGMSDSEYEQAIKKRRKELGLRDSQDLPILALCS
jgi:hypothetical protein